MSTMSLEEIRRRLEEIPAKKFGCEHETCAIGQLHHIITNGTSFDFYGNVFPPDVAIAMAALNDNISPESRKALAMMLPMPKAFPELTPAHARRLVYWAGEKALSYYTGPNREVLEQAVALAKRAAAREAYTAEEALVAFKASDEIRVPAAGGKRYWVRVSLLNMSKTLLRVVRNESWGVSVGLTVWGMARLVCRKKDEWRQWLEEYLRIRLEA